jgi:putative ribosome biogenesis GTPase RsgA
MIFLVDGGIVIDTPGMRELQLWENEEGIERTFEDKTPPSSVPDLCSSPI